MKINSLHIIVLAVTVALAAGACTNPAETADKNDMLLARAFNKTLYLSELAGMIPDKTSPEDSVMIVNAYIEKWVRESLLIHEAEKNISSDLNIDVLVRDYRASLIRHNYEKQLVEKQLDSLIRPEELNEYYLQHKEQYRLNNMILRCYLIKIPLGAADQSALQQYWKSEDLSDYKKLVDYCRTHAMVYMLNDSLWYDLPDITRHLPKDFSASSLSKRDYITADENHRYFFRVFETIPANEYPPLAYVENQVKKVILHRRKNELLEEKKEEIYERELRRSNAKIYTK